MWPSFHDFMADALPLARKPFARPHGAYVLVEASGFGEETIQDRLEVALADLIEAGVLEDVVIAASERDARDLWTVRESVSEYGRILGRILGYDRVRSMPWGRWSWPWRPKSRRASRMPGRSATAMWATETCMSWSTCPPQACTSRMTRSTRSSTR